MILRYPDIRLLVCVSFIAVDSFLFSFPVLSKGTRIFPIFISELRIAPVPLFTNLECVINDDTNGNYLSLSDVAMWMHACFHKAMI